MELTREIRDKRVAVAKDVLEQVKRRKLPLVVRSMSGFVNGTLSESVKPEDDLSTHADDLQRNCHVCAQGALLLSYARLFDNVPMRAVLDESDYSDKVMVHVRADRHRVMQALSPTFDRETLLRVEAAFECASVLESGEIEAAARWGRSSHWDDTKRLRAIMRNIIKHDGELVIPAPAPSAAGEAEG